jgi:hypothetical protein
MVMRLLQVENLAIARKLVAGEVTSRRSPPQSATLLLTPTGGVDNGPWGRGSSRALPILGGFGSGVIEASEILVGEWMKGRIAKDIGGGGC